MADAPLFEVVAEGLVTEQPTDLTCCHARCVELPGGELVACFATNSGVRRPGAPVNIR
jgi:hypothetical protein